MTIKAYSIEQEQRFHKKNIKPNPKSVLDMSFEEIVQKLSKQKFPEIGTLWHGADLKKFKNHPE